MAGIFSDIIGTTLTKLKIGIGGVVLKNSSGNLIVRNTGDTADTEITASKVNVSGDGIVLNSDSAGTGADWKITINRPTSGMTADVTFTLPVDDGTPGQVLQTDGSGTLSFVSAGSTASALKQDATALAFGTSSPVTMFTTGASDVIESITVYVDTAFNGTTPTVTVGISGTTSKYSTTADVDLKTAGAYVIHPNLVAQGAESLIATYSASTSSAGAGRIVVAYATPT